MKWPGFALEALFQIRAGKKMLPQDLDRHVAPQPGIARAIDFAHSARTEQRLDLVRPQLRSCGVRW